MIETATLGGYSHVFPLKILEIDPIIPVIPVISGDKAGARRDPRTAEIMQLSVPGNQQQPDRIIKRFWGRVTVYECVYIYIYIHICTY